MNRYQEDQLAEKVRTALIDDPGLTVAGICEITEGTEIDVFRVLDEYEVVDSNVHWRGPGQGGNWVAPEYQTAFQITAVEELGSHIGWRWPDGAIRQEQFDRENSRHINVLADGDQASD